MPPDSPILRIRHADGSTNSVRIDPAKRLLLGREPNCDLVLSRWSVSREHACIKHLDGTYILEDLGSKNGTFVNGQRIHSHPLRDGDLVTLGLNEDVTIQFLYDTLAPDTATRAFKYDFTKASLNDLANLKLLIEINKTISSSLDLEEVLEVILQGVLQISAGRRAVVLLKDEKGILQTACQKLAGSSGTADAGRVSASVVSQVLAARKPLLLHNLDLAPELKIQESIQLQSLESVVAIPLFFSPSFMRRSKRQDDMLGVLYVDSQVARKVFSEQDVELLTAFSIQAAIALEKAILHRSLQENYVQMVGSLRKAVEIKDRYTGGHSALVARFGLAIGEAMGLDEMECENLVWGGMLHDIGKIGIDEAVLNKPGRLTTMEYEAIKMHPQYGAQILEPANFMHEVVAAVLHHHERLDGSGYPFGLVGAAISRGARIIAVADIFEALTADRSYRRSMPAEEVISIIEKEAVSKLDPAAVETLFRLYREVDFDKSRILPASAAMQALWQRCCAE
jgi:putative nucleotidyltransferase with HDIG domain